MIAVSGGVFNITVDNCIFGTDPSCAHVGIHFKAPRQRGGSIHSIRVLNSVFHMEKRTYSRPINMPQMDPESGANCGSECHINCPEKVNAMMKGTIPVTHLPIERTILIPVGEACRSRPRCTTAGPLPLATRAQRQRSMACSLGTSRFTYPLCPSPRRAKQAVQPSSSWACRYSFSVFDPQISVDL